jgi:hypothetical protein
VPASVALRELTVVREYLERDRNGNWVSIRTLAAKHGVSVTPISRILKKAGVMRTALATSKLAPLKAPIVRDYLEVDEAGNWVNTHQTLADKYGVSKKSVSRIVKKAGAARTSWGTRRYRPLSDEPREAYDRGKTPLKGQQALDCRMDAAWEARNHITDVVYCRECLLPFSGLSQGNGKGHIWGAHRLTPEQYHMEWPGARMLPFVHQAKWAKSRGGRQCDLEKIIAAVVAKYLAPHQLSACRLDPIWETKQQNQEFWREHIACRVCGFIGSQPLIGHLRSHHKLDKTQYRRLYPKASTSCVANLEQLRLRNEKGENSDRLTEQHKAAKAEVARIAEELAQAKRELAKVKAARAESRRKVYTPEDIGRAIESVRKTPYAANRTAMQALNISEAGLHRWLKDGKLKRYKKGFVYSVQILHILDRPTAKT